MSRHVSYFCRPEEVLVHRHGAVAAVQLLRPMAEEAVLPTPKESLGSSLFCIELILSTKFMRFTRVRQAVVIWLLIVRVLLLDH